ncbi:hypothetical protein CU097_014668 [Rhizopus azygosporus]|uniref:Protein ZIP4 homolog n=2 Tax=Rhizopus TaxID=4842 RepID=A0A367K8J5_RHIAZ|nr:hypothetical protein CU097_014668 [Rhizopus azygosporus]
MSPNELGDLISEIIDCDLMENHLFVKRIWAKVHSLDEHNDFGLLQNAIRLWNKTINMNRKLNMNTIAICRKNMNENYIDNIESLVRQIVFNVIFLYHGRWKEDNYWQYLDITSSTLKAWLDYDILHVTDTVLSEFNKLLDETHTEDYAFLSPIQLKCLSRCYLYRAEHASINCKWSEAQESFVKSNVQCAQKDDLVINQEDSCVLQQALDQFSVPDGRNHMKYYPAKICAALKSFSVNQMTIETISQRISAMSIMDGIELLIHRHQDVQHVSAGTFYLFKIYTLYELAIDNDNEDYGDVIKSVMDGIYLVARSFDEIDLASIQLMLWRTGDYFNDKKDFTKAMPWYFHTSSIMTMTAEGQQNTLILARKIALCYAKGNDYTSACTWLENAMGTINKGSHARDYLWLVQWSIQNGDDPTKTASFVDKLVLAQDFKPTMFTDVLDSFYTECIRDDVQTLKKHYDQLPECIKTLVGLLEIEFHVRQGQFDAVIETFNVYLNLESHSFVVLERMICIVIQSDQCPHKIAFQLLKSFQRLSKLAQQTIDVYAKWTRMVISTALAYDQSEAFDCLEWMINQRLYQKHNYPQNELYYLIVVTWNEGITCYFGNQKLKGEAWCKYSFSLLNYYRQENKAQLKEQMDKAYRMFSTQKETETDA